MLGLRKKPKFINQAENGRGMEGKGQGGGGQKVGGSNIRLVVNLFKLEVLTMHTSTF